MPKTFHVTAPDGHTLEITGPDDATPEQAVAQAQQLYKPGKSSLQQSREAASHGEFINNLPPADTGSLSRDYALGSLEGLGVDPSSPVIGTAKNLASGAYNLVRHPIDTVTGAVSTAASIPGQISNIRAGTVQPGQEGQAAENLGKAVAPTAAVATDAVRRVGSIPTTAEGIQGVANKLRAIKGQPSGVPTTLPQMVRAGAGALADPVASKIETVARLRAALDRAPVDDTSPTPASAPPTATVPPTQELSQAGAPSSFYHPEAQAPPSAPIEPSPELQQMHQPVQYPEAQAPPSNPIEPSPELQQMNSPAQHNIPTEAPPRNPIEMPNTPQETPTVKGPATTREIQMAREALLQNGAARSTANLLKVSRLVPQLLDTFPELKSVRPGAAFDARLKNAFDSVGHELNATEASIPDSTQVPTGDAVTQLKALEAKYVDTNQPNAVRAIDNVKSFLADKPSMPWNDFIQAKRAFFNEIKLSSGPGREAYQIFKKLSNDVSPELGDLNQKYYLAKSAIESAAIDMKTGERIRNVGKPVKPAIQPETSGRSFILPL
jgi:hypothetical protein